MHRLVVNRSHRRGQVTTSTGRIPTEVPLMPTQWLPPIAITGSRLLRAELRAVEEQSGFDIEYADTVAAGRRYARHRPLIIVGTDLVARVRKPLTCRGLLVVASVNPLDTRVRVHSQRLGATYVIVLPTACSWLTHHLRRDMPTPMATYRRARRQATTD
ncbi:hypothetical protein ACN28G_14975 [Micromonospora sp. WMMA1923]|uniref:hypothetical protein n=1 Tax=Micromonospora sp. WMMA1923 TaxID=3404125 RepID=UPI003B939B5A